MLDFCRNLWTQTGFYNRVLLILNFIFSIALIYVQFHIGDAYKNNLINFIIALNIFFVLAYFLLCIYSISRKTKLESLNNYLEESKMYSKTLSVLHDNVRCFKHDFSNIIQAIGGYVQTDNIDGLKKYYSQLLDDCKIVNNLAVLNPEVINNPAIYSLLNSKYYDAMSKGIVLNLEIFLDLNSLDIKIYEFTRILGILLDNAIEAASECDEKLINFKICMDYNCNRQLMIIENTYCNKEIDIDKIFEKAYTTKIGNTGLGLWEVRNILNKNNNLNLHTTKNHRFFKQQLEIYLQANKIAL